MSKEDAKHVCPGDLTHYPENLRIVELAGQSCPCAGTHVGHTGELEGVSVTKVKRKKNVVKVSYTI